MPSISIAVFQSFFSRFTGISPGLALEARPQGAVHSLGGIKYARSINGIIG
jgi:hypothetical protein